MDFRTVQRVLEAGARPDRAEILRAKRLVVHMLSDGPLAIADFEQRHRHGEGVQRSTNQLELANMSEDDVKRVLGHEHPLVAGIRARVAVEVAAAELVADGIVLGYPPASTEDPAVTLGVVKTTIGSQMYSTTENVSLLLERPLLLAQRYGLRSGVSGPSAWRFNVDGFLEDLDHLAIDPRTQRSAEEAFSAYVRGSYLAAASLLGAVIEGAWYGCAERRRVTIPSLVPMLDRDQTAQVQKELCGYFRGLIKKTWRIDDLERDTRLFREIRNYGVHPRGTVSTDVERHLHEDTCGLLITTARDHLVTLNDVEAEAP